MSEPKPCDPAEIVDDSHDVSSLLRVEVPPAPRGLIRDGGTKDYTYILPVTAAIERVLNMRSKLSLQEGAFNRKKEFHVTVAGFGAVDAIRTTIAGERGEEVAAAFDRLLSETDFSFEIDPESAKIVTNLDYDADAIRSGAGRARFESQATVAMDVRMPGMAALYDKLRAELGIDLGKPATHITLFIKDNADVTGLGIAITNYDAQLRGEAFPRIESRPIDRKELSF